MKGAVALFVVGALLPGPAAAQDDFLRKLFTTKETGMGAATVSKNGKWLVYEESPNVAPGNTVVRIRPLPDGEPRQLLPASNYRAPQITPDGKRLLILSTALNRTPADQNLYAVSAPFDEATGTLTGPLRQVSLDAIQVQPRHIPRVSPDGKWLAYVECCTTGALRIVPVAGGNARTLYTPSSGHFRLTPFSLGWTPDSRSVLFQLVENDAFSRLSVSIDGGPPVVLGKAEGTIGRPMSDGKTWVVYEGTGLARRNSSIRFTTADGKPIGQPIELPFAQGAALMHAYSSNATFLVRVGDGLAPLTLAPVAGGASREISPVTEYHWMLGWSQDGSTVYSNGWNSTDVVSYGIDGKPGRRWSPPDGMEVETVTPDGYAIFRSFRRFNQSKVSYASMRLSDGKVQSLGSVGSAGSDLRGAGGRYEFDGNRMLLRQVVGDRMQVQSVGPEGDARVILDLPAGPGRNMFSVHGERVVFQEETRDSLLIRLSTGPKSTPRTIATFPRRVRNEIAWSHDGSMLALTDGERQVRFITVGKDGSTGPLQNPATLPFSYYYEPFWLPDGSGITVIAQPNGSPTTHVALIRVTDPERPVIITKEDAHDKWGHLVSPDGKYVVYPSERYQGTTFWALDLNKALEAARGGRRDP